MRQAATSFIKDENGATAIEYGFIAALIAVALIAAFKTLPPAIEGVYQAVGTKVAAQKPK